MCIDIKYATIRLSIPKLALYLDSFIWDCWKCVRTFTVTAFALALPSSKDTEKSFMLNGMKFIRSLSMSDQIHAFVTKKKR